MPACTIRAGTNDAPKAQLVFIILLNNFSCYHSAWLYLLILKMLKKVHFLVAVLLLASAPSIAQKMLIGRVNNYTYDSIKPLPNATVINITRGSSTLSDANGNYKIQAWENDRVVFSNISYTSDTIVVQQQQFISGYDAALVRKDLFLSNVTVYADYRQDSLRRREEYANIFGKQPGITGGNTPAAGAGIVLSPVSYFSKNAKQKRLLKKKLLKDEQETYIDYVFSPGRVSTLTRLRGDALQAFFNRYRPTYELARQLGYEGMVMYINNKLKEFRP